MVRERSERFGPYTVHECLGAGGMATVHRATVAIGPGVTREVALKRLLPQLADDRQFIEDFVREAKLAAQLDLPNIVHIHELGQIEQTYFIAMELVRGHSVASLLQRSRTARLTPPIGVVVALMTDLCDALDYASRGRDVHGQLLHIVHRDLTPSNLIVTDEGRLKIIDFGVAKTLSGKFMTSTGMVKGKLGYMSVEALTGAAIDARTDLFSIGVVAWELVAAKRLFTGPNEIDVISKIRAGDVEPPSRHNPACPVELDGVILRALARDRDQRWPTAAVMRRALEQLRARYLESAAQIVAWKHTLVPRPVPAPPAELDTLELSGRDLVSAARSPLAEGSRRCPTSPAVSPGLSGPPAPPADRPSVQTLDDEVTWVTGGAGDLPGAPD